MCYYHHLSTITRCWDDDDVVLDDTLYRGCILPLRNRVVVTIVADVDGGMACWEGCINKLGG